MVVSCMGDDADDAIVRAHGALAKIVARHGT